MAQGVFRPGLDAVDLYITIAAVGYFYLSNNPTLSAIFGRDLGSAAACRRRKSHNVDIDPCRHAGMTSVDGRDRGFER